MLTDKQKAEREASLGSSDAPIVAGVSPYKSPLELYYQLHGELPRYSDAETEAMEWGTRLESVIAEAFAEKTGLKIRRLGIRTAPNAQFMVAHCDYEIVGAAQGPGVLEIKARDRSDLARWETHGVPDDISLQVAHQLAVTNREWAKVAVLFSGKQFRIFDVKRDREIEECLVELEHRFILRVQKGDPPDHTWTPETVGILKKLYPADSGKTIALEMPEASQMYERFQLAKTVLAQQEAEKAEAEGWLKSHMMNATHATLSNGASITWKSTKASQRFDEDRFKQECPDLYAQYLKTVSGYRRFTVKPTKEIRP